MSCIDQSVLRGTCRGSGEANARAETGPAGAKRERSNTTQDADKLNC
jgi:hypothetical protein